MAPAERLLTLRRPALAAELGALRQRLESVLTENGVPIEKARQLVVAVNEACMNVIQHAYDGGPGGDMVLEVERLPDRWLFRLKDFAPRIDTMKLKPRDLDEVRPGGLGLPLIEKIMDDVRYPEPPAGVGNVLEMTRFSDDREE